MIQSILSNLAIILLGHLIMSTLVNYKERFSKTVFSVSVVVLFSTVVISMFYLPIRFNENYQVDLRLIPLILLVIFRGWRVAIAVLIIASAWRLAMGGEGAVPGILFGMALPMLFTFIYLSFKKKPIRFLDSLLITTVGWCISDVPIALIVPNGAAILQEIFLYRYFSFVGAASVYYAFIQLEYKKEGLRQELVYLATHDSLTKLLNKQTFTELVEKQIQGSGSNHYIAMIDIDYFKNINDQHGHLAGDRAIVAVSSIIQSFQDDHVVAARYGGEEFIVYLRVDRADEAVRIMDQLREAIRSKPIIIDEQLSLPVHVSIGLAPIASGTSLQASIQLADKYLYSAKEQGRDRLSYPAGFSN